MNFLYMTVVRAENGSLNTIWYQKDISSGRYLNFISRNPIGQKRNAAIALIDSSGVYKSK